MSGWAHSAGRGTAAAVLAAVVILGVCSCDVPDGTAVRGGAAASTGGGTSIEIARTPIQLACSQSQPTTRLGNPTLGVASDVWGDNGYAKDIDLTQLRENRTSGYTFVKAPLTVLADVEPGTELELAGPQSAALYYTGWSTWGSLSMTRMLSDASTSIVVAGCGDTVQYPGGIFVTGPACLTIRIAPGGDATRAQTVRVPIGTPCYS